MTTAPAVLPAAGQQSRPQGRRRSDPLLRYVRALDGFRACAVLAVMLYHAGVSWLPGGSFGVDSFFVLSGLLITSLLLAERRRTGRIDLRRFWGRRAGDDARGALFASRLLPAIRKIAGLRPTPGG